MTLTAEVELPLSAHVSLISTTMLNIHEHPAINKHVVPETTAMMTFCSHVLQTYNRKWIPSGLFCTYNKVTGLIVCTTVKEKKKSDTDRSCQGALSNSGCRNRFYNEQNNKSQTGFWLSLTEKHSFPSSLNVFRVAPNYRRKRPFNVLQGLAFYKNVLKQLLHLNRNSQ